MWKRIAIFAVVVAVPIGVARLVQTSTSASNNIDRRDQANTESVITNASGRIDAASLHATVEHMLLEQAEAWNAGDLDGFMEWYERGPEVTYIGSVGLIHGWNAVRLRYAPLFEPGAARDALRFEGLDTRPLGTGLALATARYVLFDGDSITSTGMFTLVLRAKREGWRIAHDHSAADSN